MPEEIGKGEPAGRWPELKTLEWDLKVEYWISNHRSSKLNFQKVSSENSCGRQSSYDSFSLQFYLKKKKRFICLKGKVTEHHFPSMVYSSNGCNRSGSG